MKLMLLADPGSSHTLKWAKSLASKGLNVSIFGLTGFDENLYSGYQGINIFTAGINKKDVNSHNKDIYKLIKYPFTVLQLKKIIMLIKPDIVHAHMATSYGLLGALSGFHPFILSLWGHDIYKFPLKSSIHKKLLQYNLHKADKLLSTSKAMADAAHKYTEKPIEVTPFGVDLEFFKPSESRSLFDKNSIVIGTIKALDNEYGVEYLLKAFGILKAKFKEEPLKLLIVGCGELEGYLNKLAIELNINNDTVFTGRVDYNKINEYHNMMTVEVYLSNSESFGVSVVEASACMKPVIVSNVGGLPEVVKDHETGFIVPPRNAELAAAAIEKLLFDKDLRYKMGVSGRKLVEAQYNWDNNLEQMVSVYKDTLKHYDR